MLSCPGDIYLCCRLKTSHALHSAREMCQRIEVKDLPGRMKAQQPLSHEEQAQLSSNDEEGSVGRQGGLLCHGRARGTRKGYKAGYVHADPSTGSSNTSLPHRHPEPEAASKSSSLMTLDGLFCHGFI